MRVVVDRDNADESRVFVTNRPVLVAPARSGPVESFADLAKPGVKLVLAGSDVPIGRYAREILSRASAVDGVSSEFAERALRNVKSEEANVRAVLTKVVLGEADAGIVYETDAAVAGKDVRVIAIPGRFNVLASYPIAVLKAARNRPAAEAFVAYLLGPTGLAILARYGFGQPAP